MKLVLISDICGREVRCRTLIGLGAEAPDVEHLKDIRYVIRYSNTRIEYGYETIRSARRQS